MFPVKPAQLDPSGGCGLMDGSLLPEPNILTQEHFSSSLDFCGFSMVTFY